MIATRSPTGTGWVDSSWATSNAAVRVSVLITPDCANRLATAAPDIGAAFGPGPGVSVACRPDFTAMTGFVLASTRANRANLRGLPNDSRYSSTTSVAVVAVPELQQVVAGHIGPVTGRDERRQTEPAGRGVGQDRDTEHARLAEEADPTRAAGPPGPGWRSSAPTDRC